MSGSGLASTLCYLRRYQAFTCCQMPVSHAQAGGAPAVEITDRNGRVTVLAGQELDHPTRQSLFSRTGDIRMIRVRLP